MVTVKELRKKASERNIKGRSKMNKAQLLRALGMKDTKKKTKTKRTTRTKAYTEDTDTPVKRVTNKLVDQLRTLYAIPVLRERIADYVTFSHNVRQTDLDFARHNDNLVLLWPINGLLIETHSGDKWLLSGTGPGAAGPSFLLTKFLKEKLLRFPALYKLLSKVDPMVTGKEMSLYYDQLGARTRGKMK